MVSVSIFCGIMLAELHHSDIPLGFAQYSIVFTIPLTVISLMLMSFPSDYQNHAAWSKFLLEWHATLAPQNAELSRFWPTLGAQLLCFTIVMSPYLRRALSLRPFLWLGKISFPLYLLHGTFMRSLLSWLLFANQRLEEMEEHQGEETFVVMRYPLPPRSTFVVVLPIYFVILFYTAHVWTQKVEPHFGTITKRAEDLMFGKEQRTTPLPVRQD